MSDSDYSEAPIVTNTTDNGVVLACRDFIAAVKRHGPPDQFEYLPPCCCFNADGTLNRDFKFTGGEKVDFMTPVSDK